MKNCAVANNTKYQFGELLFAYQNDEDEDCCSYVVVPVDLEIVEILSEGRKSVLDVLNQAIVLNYKKGFSK